MNNSESFRLETEAKQWNQYIIEKGNPGPKWWEEHMKPKLIKQRGIKSVNQLVAEMTRQKDAENKPAE